MIMSVENLSPLEQRIYTALETTPDAWLSRGEIAERIGRTDGYTQNDVRALRSLVGRGLLELRETLSGVAKLRYEYRVKAVRDGIS